MSKCVGNWQSAAGSENLDKIISLFDSPSVIALIISYYKN